MLTLCEICVAIIIIINVGIYKQILRNKERKKNKEDREKQGG